MKTLLVLSTLLVSASSFATPANAILDCNLSFGPDQQVTILSTPKGLILEELTESGGFRRRPITEAEFDSGKILLRKGDALNSGTLTLEGSRWLYEFDGSVGYASCN